MHILGRSLQKRGVDQSRDYPVDREIFVVTIFS